MGNIDKSWKSGKSKVGLVGCGGDCAAWVVANGGQLWKIVGNCGEIVGKLWENCGKLGKLWEIVGKLGKLVDDGRGIFPKRLA